MIRTFLEFLLSRSHDDGKSSAGWLRRLLLRDDQLQKFDAETRQLDALLRTAADRQRQAMATDDRGFEVNSALLTLPSRRPTSTSEAHSQNSSHSLAWLSGLAAAALVLIALAPNWFRPAPPAVHAGELSHQLTVVPGEVLRLLTRAAKTSQTQLPQLSPLANLSLPALPAWEEVALRVESPVRQEIDFWQESWQNLRLRLPLASQELPQEL